MRAPSEAGTPMRPKRLQRSLSVLRFTVILFCRGNFTGLLFGAIIIRSDFLPRLYFLDSQCFSVFLLLCFSGTKDPIPVSELFMFYPCLKRATRPIYNVA